MPQHGLQEEGGLIVSPLKKYVIFYFSTSQRDMKYEV
jgi:hypothetical protein